MKHFFKLTCVAAILTAGIFISSSFRKEKKTITTPDYANNNVTVSLNSNAR